MFIDLTQTIDGDMPVFPGTDPVQIAQKFTLAKDGFAELVIRMVSHTGTHIDAPRHLLPSGKSLDDYPVSFFIGKAMILDLGPDDISDETLASREKELRETDFLLLRTLCAKRWGRPDYFEEMPSPSLDTVKKLCSHKLRGIGIDAISIDPIRSISLDNHHNILGRNMIIIENLTNLHRLPDQPFRLIALPLKVAGSDGFSARVVAEI
jgi:kynurenine formamidase